MDSIKFTIYTVFVFKLYLKSMVINSLHKYCHSMVICDSIFELHLNCCYTPVVVTYCYKQQKIFSKNKKDLGIACHTPPLKKVKKQGEMP